MSFFAVYLLVSLKQRASGGAVGATYIGFTVNPQRRIRQHNGDIVNGAKRTSRHRPWEMVLVCHGFPSQVRLLMEMLHLEKWKHMPLQVQFLSSASLKYLANCPRLPGGMQSVVASLEALPTTCSEDFDIEDSGSICTDDFANSDCLPAAFATEAVLDTAMSASPGARRQKERPPVAAKRRGRPPKAAAATGAATSAAGGSPGKAARPRGRPRKAATAADGAKRGAAGVADATVQLQVARRLSDDLAQLAEASIAAGNDVSQLPASPAGKGGKRHASVSPSSGGGRGAAAEQAAAATLPAAPPKRGRGRPRKQSPAESGAAAGAVSPVVLLTDSESDVDGSSPVTSAADSIPLPDSPSSASCIDLGSDPDAADLNAAAGGAAAARDHGTAAAADWQDDMPLANRLTSPQGRQRQRLQQAQPSPEPAAAMLISPAAASPKPRRRKAASPRQSAATGSGDAGALPARRHRQQMPAQRAAEPDADEAVPMCTPQPQRLQTSKAAHSPDGPDSGAVPMLTPPWQRERTSVTAAPSSWRQQDDMAMTPVLCSPPMASPPACNGSPAFSDAGFCASSETMLPVKAAAVGVQVISLLTPD